MVFAENTKELNERKFYGAFGRAVTLGSVAVASGVDDAGAAPAGCGGWAGSGVVDGCRAGAGGVAAGEAAGVAVCGAKFMPGDFSAPDAGVSGEGTAGNVTVPDVASSFSFPGFASVLAGAALAFLAFFFL